MVAMRRGDEYYTLRDYINSEYIEVYKSKEDEYKLYSACYQKGRFRSQTHIISSKLCDLKRKLRKVFATKRFGGCGNMLLHCAIDCSKTT